jgi:hypothetical protein
MTETQSDSTTTAKALLQSASGSLRQKFALAKEYKQRAEHLFIIVQVSLPCVSVERNLMLCRPPRVVPMKQVSWIRFRRSMLKQVHSFTWLFIFKEVNPIYQGLDLQGLNHRGLNHQISEPAALTPILSAIRTQHLRWLM